MIEYLDLLIPNQQPISWMLSTWFLVVYDCGLEQIMTGSSFSQPKRKFKFKIIIRTSERITIDNYLGILVLSFLFSSYLSS